MEIHLVLIQSERSKATGYLVCNILRRNIVMGKNVHHNDTKLINDLPAVLRGYGTATPSALM